MIKLERSAEAERAKLTGLDGNAYDAQRAKWREAAFEFQTAVTKHAERDDVTMTRYEVEQAAKNAARHPEPAPA
ncbi:hypothetical protein DI272_19055 [Streptomyces sp. Act143]|nr:hypothetical protein DI272_19055 [Streptomyces sp. Act143]